jgi:hypothetical protein
VLPSELQEKILTHVVRSREVSTFTKTYDALDLQTTIQAFGRSVAACIRRGWLNDRYRDDGTRELLVTPEGELAFGGGVLSPSVNREQWKAVRGPYIGSSDVAAIFGIHEYGTGAWDVWDRIVLGQWNEPAQVGADIRRGNRQEPNALDRFHEVYGLEVRSASMVHHPTYHYLVSDVDGVIAARQEWPDSLEGNPLWSHVIELSREGAEIALEVKVPRTAIFYECRDTGLRTEYAVQMQHHLLCGEFQAGIFALYDPQYDDIQAFPVTRHEDFLAHLEDGLPRWYEQHVLTRVRPTRPAPGPAKWPTKVGGQAIEITVAALREMVEFVKLRHFELIEATANYEQTEKGLIEALPKEGQRFVGDGVKVERTSSGLRRLFDRKAFVAALKLAQADRNVDALLALDPNDDLYWYQTGGTEKVEVTVFASPEEAP